MTHHGNVAFADTLQKKKTKQNTKTQTRLVEQCASSSTRPSVPNARVPLQCGTSNAVRGYSPFKTEKSTKTGGEKRSLSELCSKIQSDGATWLI